MSIKDMLFAEAMGLGGGGGEPIVYTATGWNELPAINIGEYFPASVFDIAYALGSLKFTYGGVDVVIPVEVRNYISYKSIAGGTANTNGTGATINLVYDEEDEEWSVAKAWTNLMGSWIDITSSVQVGASDIELTLFK